MTSVKSLILEIGPLIGVDVSGATGRDALVHAPLPSLFQTTSAKKASEVYRCRFVGVVWQRRWWIISKFSNYARSVEKGLVGESNERLNLFIKLGLV